MELKEGVENSGFQKKFIAEKLGLSQQHFSMMLNGKADMPDIVKTKVQKLLRQAAKITV
jgi:DNA-binding LacI/PurR family transcriptional regulator